MLEPTLTGSNLIDGRITAESQERFVASRRTPGPALEPDFAPATEAEVDRAVAAAHRDSPALAAISKEARADFLEAAAAGIESLGDVLLERAHHESGLPLARLTGERGRTCNQLRMFAALVRDGKWIDVRIDRAVPDRPGGPRPDLRRMLVPIGPVAVFGASNFPLAFSVAGGDTASALAAGCPVVVKAHPAHPGTSELVGGAIVDAVRMAGLPSGTFGMVHGGAEVGRMLVRHPKLAAVAFTGSLAAGRSLFDLAAARPTPIPVFAEMGSVNPVFALPGAMAEKAAEWGTGYADSLTLGVGQFCTNPGVVVGVGQGFERFLGAAAERLLAIPPGTMLTDGIAEHYRAAVEARRADPRVEVLAGGGDGPALFAADAATFLAHPDLSEECFGPAGLAVRCGSMEELEQVARSFAGQLTATMLASEADREAVGALAPILARMAGRVILNGFPTGVEVCAAMQHGGPYPATTDSRWTSVGTAAIYRFARPVAYQGFPEDLLPEALRG